MATSAPSFVRETKSEITPPSGPSRGVPIHYDLYRHFQAALAEPNIQAGLDRSRIDNILDALESLKTRQDDDFRPSRHAYRSARFYIVETYARMQDSFPVPSFILDGERGITIRWFNADTRRTLRLNCFAEQEQRNDIYYESDAEYDVEAATTSHILARLNWLNG